MYRRFNLELDCKLEESSASGQAIYEEHQKVFEHSLESFLEKHRLNGSRLKESWFPRVNADIFLSHSHQDKDIAINLAGWIKDEFDLTVFIDSCVWGYAGNLLRKIDDRYCLTDDGNLYDYQKRNGSTSHVHMMLNVALSQMIDYTECLFFLNTPNSITTKDSVTKTLSPWIFSEIAISEVIRIKQPPRLREKENTKLAKLLEALEHREKLEVEYAVDLRGMKTIEIETLKSWQSNFPWQTEEHPLDCLYKTVK